MAADTSAGAKPRNPMEMIDQARERLRAEAAKPRTCKAVILRSRGQNIITCSRKPRRAGFCRQHAAYLYGSDREAQ